MLPLRGYTGHTEEFGVIVHMLAGGMEGRITVICGFTYTITFESKSTELSENLKAMVRLQFQFSNSESSNLQAVANVLDIL